MKIKKYISEFLGTFFLVFFGCGSALSVKTDYRNTGYLLTALSFGLILMALSYSICRISGCHVNPAVSLGYLVTKDISLVDFIFYVLSQFFGSIAACGLMSWIFWGRTGNYASNTLYNQDVFSSLVIELIITFIFVSVVLFTSKDRKRKNISGIISGLTLTLVHVFGIQFTGTSVNPARSLGPALFSTIFNHNSSLSEVWVFILAPLVGGLLAGLIYNAFSVKEKNKEKNIENQENLQI